MRMLMRWTTAPFQLEKLAVININPAVVFDAFTAPELMCRLFPWMSSITLDHSNADQFGVGVLRRCEFGNGMVLQEKIVHWQPQREFAVCSMDKGHPFGMQGHAILIRCGNAGDSGTDLQWVHHFTHANPVAMTKQLESSLDAALNNLIKHYGGSVTATHRGMSSASS